MPVTIMVVESGDPDTYDRRIGPLIITQPNRSYQVNGPMDHVSPLPYLFHSLNASSLK